MYGDKSSHRLGSMKYLFVRSLSPGKNDLFCILDSPGLYHLFWEKMGILENL